MEQQEMPLPERLRFSIWSTTHDGVVRELVREHGKLSVTLCREPDNTIDPTTVAVVCDPELTPLVVGGMPHHTSHDGADQKYVGQRIGHVARKEPFKDLIWERLVDAPMRALLIEDELLLVLELISDIPDIAYINDLDDDIPF